MFYIARVKQPLPALSQQELQLLRQLRTWYHWQLNQVLRNAHTRGLSHDAVYKYTCIQNYKEMWGIRNVYWNEKQE